MQANITCRHLFLEIAVLLLIVLSWLGIVVAPIELIIRSLERQLA